MSALDLATATKCCRRATRERHSFATLRQVDGRWGRALYRAADTPTEQAFVYSGFYGADESNVGDTRALTLWRASCRRAWSGSARRAQLVLHQQRRVPRRSTYRFGVVSASARIRRKSKRWSRSSPPYALHERRAHRG